MTLRRYVVRIPSYAAGALVWLSVLASYNVTAAQVGYDPAHSPYHDLPRGGAFAISVGYFSGGRGDVGVGLSDGPTAGIRYEVPFGAIGASLGVAYGRTNRFVVNPYKDTLSRKTGPYDQDVWLIDAGLQLSLTGRKSWRGFAPYVGGTLGVAVGGTEPRDTSGYKFGTEFMIGPTAGVRWYPSRRLSVRGDFRLILWKLDYPAQYKVPPANAPNNPAVLPLTASLTDWTTHAWGTIGLGWNF